jgi:hypothetical protein
MEWGVVAFCLIIIIAFLFYSPSFAKKNKGEQDGPYQLEKRSTILTVSESEMLYSTAAASFSSFIYLNPMNRTGEYPNCVTNPNQVSCNGKFAPCECDPKTKDCSVCLHSGYKPIVNISNVFILEILNAPDASRTNKVPAQLLIQTENQLPDGTFKKYIETMILPPLDIQKWAMITIAHEGRRVDVYYNDQMVLSEMPNYKPISDRSKTNLQGVVSGSEGLFGQITLIKTYDKRLSNPEVIDIYKNNTDTLGNPRIGTNANPYIYSDPSGLNPGFKSGMTLSSFFCFPGQCLDPPVVRSASPTHDWSSPYG